MWLVLVCNLFYSIATFASDLILEMRQNPGQLPATHADVFTLTSPVCIVRDYVILNVCKKKEEEKNVLSVFLPPSPWLARCFSCSLSAKLKERRFYPPADLWYTLSLRLHTSYITRLKQGCCNERYLGGARSLRNSSICQRKDLAQPQLTAKTQCCIKPRCVSSSRFYAMRSLCIQITLRNRDSVASPWFARLCIEARMTSKSIIRR